MRSSTPLTNTEIALAVYPPATANVVVDPSPVNCCLTAVNDAVGIETVVDVNGERVALVLTGPLFVILFKMVELSTIDIDCRVNKLVDVPVIAAILVPDCCVAANGVVEGVNAPVYTATPFTIRRFDIYPVK